MFKIEEIKKMRKFKIKHNEKWPLVAASDAFFPFVDGIEKLIQAGVTAIIQPYGSIRDKEVIKFADKIGSTTAKPFAAKAIPAIIAAA